MTQTVLITGCSSGLGRTAALYFANKGWNVVATMRSPERSRDFNGFENVMTARLDVQDPSLIEAAIAASIERFGSIDVLVNNAGFGLFGVFETIPGEKVREQFDVNVFGAMNTIRGILPHFRARGAGLILNVSSGAGVFALPMISLYCASKFALEGFSESLSYELASQNVRVKIIEPGGVVSTDFGKRSSHEASQVSPIMSYEEFVSHANRVFANLRSSRSATEQDVAAVIYAAASDGTSQLRYVATEDIKPLIRYRRETSEQEYMSFMQSQFS